MCSDLLPFLSINSYYDMNDRICKKCQKLTPMSKMWNRHGWICNVCAAKHTSFKYRIYKNRARSSDIEFQLTKEEFLTFWQKPCTYCGDAIETIGLDRIDSNLGYTLNNVISCCTTCNMIKYTENITDFKNRIQRIINKHGEKNDM